MSRLDLYACGIAMAILSCACGRSAESRRITQLEERLSTLEDRIQEAQEERTSACAALRAETAAIQLVETAPIVPADGVGYLDGTGMSFGSSFDWQTRAVLAEGAASISGQLLADGRARAGVRLRLFLSGIRSAWATSDSTGHYVLRVPPGKYSYQGFELDPVAADRALPGMLLRGDRGCPRAHPVDASPEKPGQGPDFYFVTAVSLLSPTEQEIMPRNQVRLAWKAYPGATDYEVMLMERDGAGMGGRSLAMPAPSLRTSDTSLLIPDHIRLSPGRLYTWTITAYDTEGDEISHSPGMKNPASFKVE